MKYEWSSPSITWHRRLHSYLLNVISEGNSGDILRTEHGDRELNIKISRANVVNNRHLEYQATWAAFEYMCEI
jgi:hypothetical protein